MPRESEDSFELSEPLLFSPNAKEKKNRSYRWMTFCGAIALVLVGAVLDNAVWHIYLESTCTKHMSAWSPAIDDGIVRTSNRKAVAKFAQHNEYRGFPGEVVDNAWSRISLEAPGIRLSEDDVRKMNKTPEDLWTFKDNEGQHYLGMLEVAHLLHCLDSLRQMSYRALYHNRTSFPPLGEGFDLELKTYHVDHCLDALRESLMCSSDVSIVAFNRDKKNRTSMPLADFGTQRKCRNFEDVLAWNHRTLRRVEWRTINAIIGVPGFEGNSAMLAHTMQDI